MNKNCLVTGGAGFIGSHLCELLLVKGYKVVCVDDLSSGRLQNISSFRDHPSFVFINFDITKPYSDKLRQELDKSAYIFHLASPASPNKNSLISYYSRPIETLLVNSYGTYKLLESTRRSGAKFLFASTSEIYGDPEIHPQSEKYWGNVNPVGERSCYDEAKRFGEAITFTYHRKYQVNIRIIRIFNTYGPRMHKEDGRAVVEFINQSLEGKPITIFGDGSQTRSFCYVDDLVEGIYKAMFTSNTSGSIINLGNPQELTVLEIAKIIKKLTGSKSTFLYGSLPFTDDPKRRKPDITKAKKLLNWIPKISLNTGLTNTINFFKNYPA